MLHVHNSEEMQTRHHTSKTRLETLFREINQQFHYYYFIFLFFRKILILTQLIKYRKVRSSFLPIHFKVTFKKKTIIIFNKIHLNNNSTNLTIPSFEK